MPLAATRLQVDVCDTSYFDIVQRKFPFQVNRPYLVLKISSAQICSLPIQSDSEFSAAPSLCKFDMNISEINPIFEGPRRPLRSQAALHRVPPFRQTTYQVIPFLLARPASIRRRRGFLSAPLRRLLHLLPQAEWPHIGPYFFDVGEALRLRATLPYVFPAEWHFLILRPDGILLFMVYNYSINCSIFLVGIM